MRNLLSQGLSKIGGLFKYLSNKVYVSPFKKQKGFFVKQVGDSTKQLSFLNENSLVFDVGGYVGQWASDIYGMYNCHIYIFEPVQYFVENIKKRFERNKKININSFGLGGKNETISINVSADGSSTIKKVSNNKTDVKIVDIIEFIKQNNIQKIDLIKINIEGGEYELLNRLIDSGFIHNIDNILVQFHNFFPEAKNEMNEIKDILSYSHKPIYQYEFIWELWSKK